MGDDPMATFRPAPGADVEAVLVAHMVRRVVIVGPAVLVAFWLTRGLDGALAAALGIAVVTFNFWLSGQIMTRSARISLSLYHAAALLGFFLRLGLITATLVLVARAIEIDRVALGLAAVVSYLVLLAWEAVAVANGAEREAEWSG